MPKIITGMFLLLLSVSIVFAQQESGQAITGTGTIGPPSKTLNVAVPSYIINISNNYIKSFVGSDYFDKHLAITDNKTFQSGTGEISYSVSYSYDIPSAYLASPGTSYVSVSLDKDGNITDYLGPKKPHTFSITKEQVIEKAKENGLKEPIVAEIDRVLKSNSTDGYVWVVTGAIDKTTCRYIGGTQECLIPGIYVDVDDGSVISGFNSSSLILKPGPATSAESISVVIIGIIVLLAIIFILLYKFKLKK